MSIVTLVRNHPAYAFMRGALVAGGGASTVVFAFANTFISANKIVRNSATRITFGEAGTYEIAIPFEVETANSCTLQYGINGSWTTIATSATPTSSSTFTIVDLIIDIPRNAYLEFRVTGTNISDCFNGNLGGAQVPPVGITIKKL